MGAGMIGRIAVFIYGVLSYAVFFGAFLYLVGFLANMFVPKSIDIGESVGSIAALVVNVGLIVLFGLQHSVMARRGFKRNLTKWLPTEMERSTYVLMSSLALLVLYLVWQPMPAVVWQFTSSVGAMTAWVLYASGLALVLASTFLIDHFELFGLKQVFQNLIGRLPVAISFQVRFLYRFVRHPLYLGWLFVFWATPTMTQGHLLFALGMSAYIFIGIHYEERDLIDTHGVDYERYRDEVPMLMPKFGKSHCPVVPDTQNRST